MDTSNDTTTGGLADGMAPDFVETLAPLPGREHEPMDFQFEDISTEELRERVAAEELEYQARKGGGR